MNLIFKFKHVADERPAHARCPASVGATDPRSSAELARDRLDRSAVRSVRTAGRIPTIPFLQLAIASSVNSIGRRYCVLRSKYRSRSGPWVTREDALARTFDGVAGRLVDVVVLPFTAGRLGPHFGQPVVHPEPRERLAGRRLALGEFVLVMWEHVDRGHRRGCRRSRPRYFIAIAEHSMCHPGRPLDPTGLSHDGSPGLAAFQSAKSAAAFLAADPSSVRLPAS